MLGNVGSIGKFVGNCWEMLGNVGPKLGNSPKMLGFVGICWLVSVIFGEICPELVNYCFIFS